MILVLVLSLTSTRKLLGVPLPMIADSQLVFVTHQIADFVERVATELCTMGSGHEVLFAR